MESSFSTHVVDGDQVAFNSGDKVVAFAGTGSTSNCTLTVSDEEFVAPLR